MMPWRTIYVSQSNYIPWKGYFDSINAADDFVILDDVQYTKRDWRNRNLIKTPKGVEWLTIPVHVKGRFDQRIDEVETTGQEWRLAHWKSLEANYSRAPFYSTIAARLEPVLLSGEERSLSEINRALIALVCDVLGITTQLRSSADFELSAGKNQRLIDICRQAGASHYLSGPAARAYIDEEAFAAHGIEVHYRNYDAYPEYPQLFGPFEHGVSILDLLFNTGASAPRYMKSFVA